jgi:hypothetical protein
LVFQNVDVLRVEVQRPNSKSAAALVLANYLMVLLAGESFHNHGMSPHGQHVHTACCHHTPTATQHDSTPPAAKCACHRRAEVEQVTDCLTCKFWAQKTLPQSTESPGVSSQVEHLSPKLCRSLVPASIAIPEIRGPPSIA